MNNDGLGAVRGVLFSGPSSVMLWILVWWIIERAVS